MSLINNMLKDLEKNVPYQRDIPNIALMADFENPRFLPVFKKIISYTISIILVAMIAYFIINRHHATPGLLAPITHAQPSTPLNTNPSNESASWLKPALITAATVQVKENVTELTLLLNHATLYRINSESVDGQYTLVLEHAQLMSELPAIHPLNTAIENIAVKSVNGDTRIQMTLYPGANIRYVNLNEKERNPELVVAIEYQQNNAQSPKKTTLDAVKTPAIENVLMEQYQSALTQAETGDYDSAIATLTAIIKMDATFKDARVSLIALLIDQGHIALAKQHIEQGLTINPDYIPLIELKARTLALNGNVVQALNLLQSVSPNITDNPDYHAFIAALYQRNNNNTLAINIYKQLLTINPHNGSWWFGLGVSLEKLGKDKLAMNAYAKAMTEGHLNVESVSYLRKRLQPLQEDQNDHHQTA